MSTLIFLIFPDLYSHLHAE